MFTSYFAFVSIPFVQLAIYFYAPLIIFVIFFYAPIIHIEIYFNVLFIHSTVNIYVLFMYFLFISNPFLHLAIIPNLCMHFADLFLMLSVYF